MPASDYNSAGGGALKLKGSKPVGVEKKRKKKKSSTTMTSREAPSPSRAPPTESKESEDVKDDSEREDLDGQIIRAEKKSDDSNTLQAIKTRAEREQEERRRKRLDDRFQREGLKTHKERVEELNKYLSNLSEHHDMPRIGPG